MRYAFLAMLFLLSACSYDCATDTWHLAGNCDHEPSTMDSMEKHLTVQRYMRQHDGKMPPPDLHIDP
jgi:hypothetical protein